MIPAIEASPLPHASGDPYDPVISMVVYEGRLFVATSRGLFVKRENENAFDRVNLPIKIET